MKKGPSLKDTLRADFKYLCATYTRAQQDVERAKRKAHTYLQTIREYCTHDEVAEAPYAPGDNLGNAWPPARICKACGAEEEGWGCGWQALKDAPGRKVTQVDRSAFYLFRKPGPLYKVGQSKDK